MWSRCCRHCDRRRPLAGGTVDDSHLLSLRYKPPSRSCCSQLLSEHLLQLDSLRAAGATLYADVLQVVRQHSLA